jgi:plastocyanin
VTDPYTGVAPNSHSITFDDGVGNSGMQSNGKHTRQFTAAGTFPYYCSIHGRSVMSGAIVVQ